MANKLSYYEDPHKVADEATIVSLQRDDKSYFVLLDHTIFYPQGGGQPSDQGRLELDATTIPVLAARMVDGEVRHYIDQDYSHIVGKRVQCIVDRERRLLHAKLHTFGHLISNVLENLYPSYKAIKGHHFPGECYVEFVIKSDNPENIDLERVKREIAACINQNRQVQAVFVTEEQFRTICPDSANAIPAARTQSIRLVKIGNFSYQPCGGLHVSTTLELQGLEITKFKMKTTSAKIYYL
jgi:alanyl-tRNA synthetase